MANMGYVRFQNTLRDLEDCEEHLFDTNLSPEEHRARVRLVKLCIEIGQEFFCEEHNVEMLMEDYREEKDD